MRFAPERWHTEGEMKHEILIEEIGLRYDCEEQESVLAGMVRLCRKGIPVGCRGGGCGVCKVQVTGGRYECRSMSRNHVSPEEQEHGIVLACRIAARSDLSLRVFGKMQKMVSKSATPTGSLATDCSNEGF